MLFWSIFCPFTPLTWKIKILNNWKKLLEIVSFYTSAPSINDNHMMNGFWDMKRNGQNFLSFWTVFCPFTPLTPQKIKILKNWKNPQEISSFYTSVSNIMITQSLYCSSDMVRNRCHFYFLSWAISCHFTSLTAQQIKILKKKKKIPGDITILRMCTKNYNQMMYSSWDMVHAGRMEGQMEKVTYRGWCPT